MSIAENTGILPEVKGWLGALNQNDRFSLSQLTREEGVRSPVNLSFSAIGATFSGGILARGDVLMGQDSSIKIDGMSSVTFGGQTITLHGSVIAPGGSISVIGPASFPLDASQFPANALATVHLGGSAMLSTAGKEILVSNPYELRQGRVLAGGSIKISGNIVAEVGAVLDVSGATGILDLPPSNQSLMPSVPNSVNGRGYVPVTIQSNAGTITLSGGEMLFSDATLIGNAGGGSATGGTLNVSSNRFVPVTLPYTTADVNLLVTQNGIALPASNTTIGVGVPVLDATGSIAPQLGYFSADRFANGGFDSLSLGGNVRFEGQVSIAVPGSLKVADGGVIYANDHVTLTAAHVTLGQAFQSPSLQSPILFSQGIAGNILPYSFGPSHGKGTLTVNAKLIDIGTLSLQGIGNAEFLAPSGDIRGNGTLQIAGGLTFEAGQIYPPSERQFNVFAYDYTSAGTAHEGAVTIRSGAVRSMPLSAGGALSIYASQITQGGTLRAPIGTINLGWDGTGAAPFNPITGTSLASPVTSILTLVSGSITSVSTIDPISGKATVIPYGISLDGKSWIDPAGNDITVSGPPGKAVNLAAVNLVTEASSSVDISGGGDLYAYRWISGNGGSEDILASSNSFAVIPSYGFNYSPYAPFNSDNSATNLAGAPGYVNSTLKAGDQITLAASKDLPAGTYTLLPARYALLPGALLVTPKSTVPTGTVKSPDGSSIVAGYRSNNLDPSRTGPTLIGGFEIAPASVVRARAQYQDLLANTVLREAAISREFAVPRLPVDAGYLAFSSPLSMILRGSVSSLAPTAGRGSVIDINSSSNIIINSSGIGTGGLVLSATTLNSFGAESLLIGGIRSFNSNGASVTANSADVTLDNAGTSLTGKDIILVSREKLTLAENSEMVSKKDDIALDTITLGDTGILGSGNGSLVRVSADASGQVSRLGVSSSSLPKLTVRSGVILAGGSIVLDSTAGTNLAESARLNAGVVSLNSGQISISLNNPGALNPTTGLVLAGDALSSLQNSAKRLALLSYSTLDIYGTGVVGSRALDSLSLQAAAIRSFNASSETVSITAANLSLGNSAASAASSPLVGTPAGSITFDADQITLGANAMRVEGYANTTLSATSGILTSGQGSFDATGDLTFIAPLLTGSSTSKYAIRAVGALQLNKPAVSRPSPLNGGFGADLTLQGASVKVNGYISLPSGKLTLHATSGDLTLGDTAASALDLTGTSNTFVDTIRYTSGGTANLISDAGSVTMAAAANINVSAKPGGGNAGAISVKVPLGIFDLKGVITGTAGATGNKGEFSLDAGSVTGGSLASLDSSLNAGNFTQSRDYRIRTGDVNIDGLATSRIYRVSADSGTIRVSNTINASGLTGGTIDLKANGSLILENDALLNASGAQFDAAGKGGAVTLEAGNQRNGDSSSTAVLDLQSGSSINLSVAAANATSESLGKFSGTLHLRAPRNTANSDLQVNAIGSSIKGASSILAEGVKLYDLTDYGGTISSAAQSWVQTDGQAFLGTADTLSINETTITTRLLSGQTQSEKSKLASILVLAPGVEMINTATASNTKLNLNSAGSTLSVPPGGSVLFPNGSSGNSVRSSVAATIVSTSGEVTSLEANTPAVIPAGSKLLFGNSSATVTYATIPGSPGGAIGISLVSGSTYTTGSTAATNSSATVSERGTVVTLNTASSTLANASSLALSPGTSITFPSGTGSSQIRSTAAGQITSRTGDVTLFNANTNISIPAGSYITLNAPGSISYVSGTGGVSVALASGSFTTNRAVTVTPTTGDLTLGTLTSTATSDWNLESFRYGSKSAPGVLTLRSTGNLVFYNALSDGFAAVTPSASNGQSSL
ncbi:MAG: hypothetical protein ABI600_10475, partial [Luteolibacter sp.]